MSPLTARTQSSDVFEPNRNEGEGKRSGAIPFDEELVGPLVGPGNGHRESWVEWRLYN